MIHIQIYIALAEKLAAMRTADFFRERAKRGNVRKAMKVLARAGKRNPPVPDDELP